MHVLLYAKSNSNGKNEDQKRNAEIQLRALRNFARQQGWTVVGEFSDKPLDAWDDRRGFVRLLARVMKGGVQAIVVPSLEHLGLSNRQFIAFADDLHDRGVCVVTLREGHDVATTLRGCIRCSIDLLSVVRDIGRVLGR